MAHQSGSEGVESPDQSTQPFSENDWSYQVRLAAALQDRSTQAFDTQDPAYKARLQEALGEQLGADPDHNSGPLHPGAADPVPPEGQAEADVANSERLQGPQPLAAFLEAANNDTRLLFLPSDPESFELKHVDVEGHHSPAGKWINVLWEVDEDESIETLRVLAVSPPVYNTACHITIRGASKDDLLTFQVSFDPSSNDISLLNTHPSSVLVVSGSQPDIQVYYSSMAKLGPGQWDISLPKEACATKLLVLPRRSLPPPALTNSPEQPGKKRGALPASQDPDSKRARGAGPHVKLRTLAAVPGQAVNAAISHPLIDLRDGRTIELIGSRPEEKYSVTRIKNLSDSRSSSVWRAIISILTPDHPSVVTKALRPTGNNPKSVTTMWLRETSIHSTLTAGGLPTVVQLLGLDARVHSLYLEDIAAPSLAHRAWRGPDGYFLGTPADARRVLDGMASAVSFVHDNGIAHNDIKPGNILFSAARGAVLVDFGLSSETARPSAEATTYAAGTPWYVPPEFRVDPETGRGAPGDVWALGVVMLYLRRQLAMPDTTADWQIWLVLVSQMDPDAAEAVARVSAWVEKVLVVREQLGVDPMDEAIRGMTEPGRPARWTIHAVAAALRGGGKEPESHAARSKARRWRWLGPLPRRRHDEK